MRIGDLRCLYAHRHVNIVVADQLVVSCGNFVFGVLLARAIGVIEFGRFTLAWLVVDFIATLQSAIVLQPMLNIGPKQTYGTAPAYYGAVAAQQLLLLITLGFLAWAGAALVGTTLGPRDFIALASPLGAAVATVQAHDFLRRYFFAREQPVRALSVDLARYCFQIGGALLLSQSKISPTTGAAGLWLIVVATGCGAVLGLLLSGGFLFKWAAFRASIDRHWDFCKWLLPSAIVNAVTGQVFLIVAGTVLGAAAVGALNIAKTALGFLNVLLLALGNFAPVRAARTIHLAGSAALRRYVLQLTVITLGLVVATICFVGAFPGFLIRTVYGTSFLEAADLVRWYCGAYLFYAISAVLFVWAAASESTKIIFLSCLATSVFAVVSAYPLARLAGITGVAGGIVASEFIRVSILGVMLFRGSGTNLIHADSRLDLF
jgi:O-antigen/teichoic acid export membrane protein